MENTKVLRSLYMSAISGDAETLQQVLDANQDLDVNVKNIKGLSALQLALDQDSSEVIRILLHAGADVNTISKNGRTALDFAMKKKDTSILEYLLAHNVSVDTKIDDKSLLHFVAFKNRGNSHFSMIEALLKNGADPNVRNELGKTPLHVLAYKAGVKTVKLFLNYKADVSIKNNEDETVLFDAASFGNFEVLKLLIDLGLEVNYVNKDGSTPLHKAAQNNKVDSHYVIIEELLKNGSDVNALDQRGNTALNEVICNFTFKPVSIKVVKLLLNFEADVNIKNKDGKTSLFYAINSLNVEITQLLIDHGADVKVVAAKNSKLTLNAALCNSFDMTKLLLENGANVNAQDEFGKTSLHYLAKEGCRKLVQLFLSFKAEVNSKNNDDETPLFEAVRQGNILVTRMLLNHGAIVNCSNNMKSTPLLEACKCDRNVVILKCLLKNGASIEDFKSDEKTFSDCVSKYCRGESGSQLLRFFFKYADMSLFNFRQELHLPEELMQSNRNNFLTLSYRVLEHIAKLQTLDLLMNSSILNVISNHKNLKKYFNECIKELEMAKGAKLKNSWVSFFNLLVDNKRKLKNYAGNEDLIEDFNKSDCKNKFPIYGAEMEKNVEKGIERKDLFDKAAVELSNCLPIFNPTHLVIRDVLDCVSTKGLSKFCD